ncbi:MAG: exo-alpha-sialidase [Rhodoplanes sp.]|uniref:WD40/YVTN/BNR-like repeat-containing protein n=1 Tax=Rhodoplanes sp. TaxID=1968906 RepID=UPI0017A904AE|nr:sialidase family protein [Rhodoplanes sp.]NVO14284.1 exo-alpha-sialidase [Rhodoplanes sp.]
MSDTLLVSTRKGLFTVLRDGTRWDIAKADFLGDNVTLTVMDPRDGRRYAALDHGHFGVKLHRSTATGWEEIATPAYPEKPAGLEENDMWGRPLPWSTVRIWALTPGGTEEPGTIWCGTLPGGLFKSTDHGESWSLVRALWDHPKRPQWMGGGADLPGLHSVCVDPRNSRHVSIAVSTGGVWHTADGGETWSQRGEGMRADHVPPELTHDPIAQDVHCLVQCQAAPERMWVQHHNGIFVSSDAGRSFTEIPSAGPSTFGFPVAVHPEEPDTAWFVPEIKDEKRIPCDGRLVVTRTRDGGKSFEVLTRGLPDRHAYDVVYRHALALDPAGERLAFGSTTGGLWVSENQGDAWTCVTHTLPPVYAVRFG